jgi:hypothetical protein
VNTDRNSSDDTVTDPASRWDDPQDADIIAASVDESQPATEEELAIMEDYPDDAEAAPLKAAALDLLRRLRDSGYDPNEERDDQGKWTKTGGDGDSKGGSEGGGKATPFKPTLAERGALMYYTGMGYSEINGVLRGEEKPNIALRLVIKALDKALGRATLASDLTVYRGTRGALDGLLQKIEPGTILDDRAFMSTSRLYQIAKSSFGGPVMEIKMRAGQNALDVSTYSLTPLEQEVLLPRGVQLRYIGKGDSGYHQFEVHDVRKVEDKGDPRLDAVLKKMLDGHLRAQDEAPPPESDNDKFADDGVGLIIHYPDGRVEKL